MLAELSAAGRQEQSNTTLFVQPVKLINISVFLNEGFIHFLPGLRSLTIKISKATTVFSVY